MQNFVALTNMEFFLDTFLFKPMWYLTTKDHVRNLFNIFNEINVHLVHIFKCFVMLNFSSILLTKEALSKIFAKWVFWVILSLQVLFKVWYPNIFYLLVSKRQVQKKLGNLRFWVEVWLWLSENVFSAFGKQNPKRTKNDIIALFWGRVVLEQARILCMFSYFLVLFLFFFILLFCFVFTNFRPLFVHFPLWFIRKKL